MLRALVFYQKQNVRVFNTILSVVMKAVAFWHFFLLPVPPLPHFPTSPVSTALGMNTEVYEPAVSVIFYFKSAH